MDDFDYSDLFLKQLNTLAHVSVQSKMSKLFLTQLDIDYSTSSKKICCLLLKGRIRKVTRFRFKTLNIRIEVVSIFQIRGKIVYR